MNSSVQKQTSPRSDQQLHRQQLLSDINACQLRIQQYQQLEKDINSIKNTLPMPSPKSKPVSDRINNKHNYHVKVKVYQLQKKLDRARQELNNKNHAFIKMKESHQKLNFQISVQSTRIDQEKGKANQLRELQMQLQSDLERTGQQCEQAVRQLEDSVRNKQTFIFERKQLRDQLWRIRTLIQQMSQNRQESTNKRQQKDTEFNEKGHQKRNTELSLSDSSDIQEQGYDLNRWRQREQRRLELLLDRLAKGEQGGQQVSRDISHTLKELASNQVIKKHHRLTWGLRQSQLEGYLSATEGLKITAMNWGTRCGQLGIKLGELQGERGWLRGQIGVRIQQQRLLRSVNILLQQQLTGVRQKYQSLRMLRGILESGITCELGAV